MLCVTDETELKDNLATVLGGGIDTARAAHDGARFLAAVKATSFDLGQFDLVRLDRFDPATIEAAYGSLRESLSPREGVVAAE